MAGAPVAKSLSTRHWLRAGAAVLRRSGEFQRQAADVGFVGNQLNRPGTTAARRRGEMTGAVAAEGAKLGPVAAGPADAGLIEVQGERVRAAGLAEFEVRHLERDVLVRRRREGVFDFLPRRRNGGCHRLTA